MEREIECVHDRISVGFIHGITACINGVWGSFKSCTRVLNKQGAFSTNLFKVPIFGKL